MRWRTGIGVGVLLAALVGGEVRAQGCSRAEFEAVVDQASAKLRDLVQRNTAEFQGKLRALKAKRGWTHDQFMSEGARFVRDDRIAEYDERSETLLARINSDSASKTPDCTMLGDLKATMATLIEVQEAKWRHMSSTIDAELAK
jgi:predicted dithiol-disulfide oxidoreductase (DUF899 family)